MEQLVKERLKLQPELLKAYPDFPCMDLTKITTFKDYAYAAHDQADFLLKSMEEMKSMHESNFMTKRAKELMREKKALEEELSLA